MSVPTIADSLEKATKGQLEQMLAQAETYLSAQLTVGTAGDQRALVFAGFLAAIVVALGGGASALLLKGSPLFLGYLGFLAAIGLLIAFRCAVYAARPVSFEYAGNTPAEWEADVADEKPLVESMREQAIHYAGMIAANNETLRANCEWLQLSQRIAFWTLGVSGMAFLGFFAIRDLGAIFCG